MSQKLFKRDDNKSLGFTLIEVVIVLAIAGLIFVIVFLAVAGAQRGRRDTQRRSDMSRVAAAVNQWSGNNNGTIPTEAEFNAEIVGGASPYVTDFRDPSTGTYTHVAAPAAAGQYNYIAGQRCNGDTPVAGGARDFAVAFALENGRGCVSSS